MITRLFYCFILYFYLPFAYFRMWRKGLKSPAYHQRWAERLGFFQAPNNVKHGICFHCVSVGETNAAIPLIKNVQRQYPQWPITVTTMTPTGSEQVRSAFGDSVFHVYLPFDTPNAVKRFLAKIRPRLMVIIETELWPNLLHFTRINNTKVLLANARLSEKSAAGYKKYQHVSREMMSDINIVAAQNSEDALRFNQLGLDQDKLIISGNIKFDIQLKNELTQKSQRLKKLWAKHRAVWVVGSIHFKEVDSIIQAFKQVLLVSPDVLLIVAPRHPEIFTEVAGIIENAQLSMRKRSDNMIPQADTQVFLADSMGELLLFWGMADIAFVGGSLIERGGHNPLEPAAFGLPVLSGPHVFNFKAIYQLLEQREAVLITNNPQELATRVLELLHDKAYRESLGHNALKVIEENSGAISKLMFEVEKLLH